jgi:hypothetical protein
MILSFSITSKLAADQNVTDPLITGIKTVSRRDWKEVYAQKWVAAYNRGDLIHDAWSNAPFVKGAYKLGSFRLACEPYKEVVGAMPDEDLINEGGFWKSKQSYIDEVCNGDRHKVLWVVRWENFQIIFSNYR